MKQSAVKRSLRVLAVDPGTRGFGYAVFEGPTRLVDWGTRDIRHNKGAMTLTRLELLLRQFEPDILVMQDCGHVSSRRNPRITFLIERMRRTARSLGIEARALPLALVYRHFAKVPARNKHEIATALAQCFPGLALRLPPKRKPWQSEDSRMSIFDAAALALTYYATRRRRVASDSSNPDAASG